MPIADPRLQAILDQLDTFFLLLERPAVQRQLAAFILIFLLSWLLPAPLGFLLNKLLNRRQALVQRRKAQGLPVNPWRTRLLRWARGLQLVLFPTVGLVASQLTIGYFDGQGWPMGLLERLAALFWLILIFRVAGSILFATLAPEHANLYQRRFITPIFVILVALVVGAGLDGTFPIFDIELFSILSTPLTVRAIAAAIVVFYIFLAVGWITRDLLNNVVLPRTQADPGVSNTVRTVSHYAIIGIGILAAMSTVGFDLSALAIIGGGLSVGIGFGLQELVANFISGILLLFEQTLRPGDIIEVGGQKGTVSQLRMRATVLRTVDNIDVYVPNKTLLTSTVSAYTNVDRNNLRIIRVGVGYKSDPTKVRDVLQKVVESHGLVLKDPEPAIFFAGFGDSTLNFEVIIWTDNPLRTTQVVSDLHFMIFREFARNEIEIPFPQRDLHLVSAPGLDWEQLAQRNGHAPDGRQQNGQQAGDDDANTPAEPGNAPRQLQPALADDKTTPPLHSKEQQLSPERIKAPAEKPHLPW